MSFSTGCRKCQKCGKMYLIRLFDSGLCAECEKAEQDPISVSVSEKESGEISEEVTLRFFRNSLKVRWQDFVIYNVEWLKKNWQMEMDIVCGVKPCDDVVSRQAVFDALHSKFADGFDSDRWWNSMSVLYAISQIPSVTQKSGKWIEYTRVLIPEPINKWEQAWYCSECGYGNQECEDGSAWLEWQFCPNCGCRMQGGEK